MVAEKKLNSLESGVSKSAFSLQSLPGMVVVVEFVVVELVVWQCALPLYCLVYLYQTYQGQANLRMLKYGLDLIQ